jgi:glycogen operon protein
MNPVVRIAALGTALVLAALGAPAPLAAQTPLGATLVTGGVQFAVFSEHATRIEVWIFANPGDSAPASTHGMTQTDPVNHVWTVTVSSAGAGTLYGLRAWGPNWTWSPGWTPGTPKAQDPGFVAHVDAAGNRFNPNKLLTDPYAKAVTGEVVRVVDPVTGERHYAAAYLGGTDQFGFLDSAGVMPKSIVIDDAYDWSGDVRPATGMEDSVVYEVHLRGFSRGDGSLAAGVQGTYDGFAAKAGYLADLGVTAVELLPVHEYPQYDDPITSQGAVADRVNYWGYMTTQFFAPNREYLCRDFGDGAAAGSCPTTDGRQVTEFKDLVRALHAQGLEVWLDVVFNHTAEGGGCAGSVVRYYNLRGLDNQNYYTLADDRTCNWETTGTGNNLNASRPAVRRLILDSLAYWIDEMGVDGFRFDLAYTLGREGADGRIFNPNAQTLQEIAQLGADRGVKMVAEAWDTSGYGVGQFPSGWSEWNGLWRDNVRRFVIGVDDQVGNLGASITASWSGFAAPPESVNFITAHDGFTLNDLVSYNSKLNGVGPCNPSGADPASGSTSNDSWDHGGDETLRRREIRNFAAHLLVHHGVPMIVAGDEFRNTQFGNNNGYMADNPCGWLDWTDPVTHAGTRELFRRMIALREAHPGLARGVHVSGTDHDGDGVPDLGWHGVWPGSPDWSSTSHTLAFLVDGSSAETGGAPEVPDLYVAYNAYWGNLDFHLPAAPGGKCWYRVVDTADWAETAGNIWFDPAVSDWSQQPLDLIPGTVYGLQARSTLILAARDCPCTSEVTFEVNGLVTQPGQDLFVVGSASELGSWSPAAAVPLTWIDSDTWRGPVCFEASAGQSVQYKYILKQNGTVTWENGGNRVFTVPASGTSTRVDSWQL